MRCLHLLPDDLGLNSIRNEGNVLKDTQSSSVHQQFRSYPESWSNNRPSVVCSQELMQHFKNIISAMTGLNFRCCI